MMDGVYGSGFSRKIEPMRGVGKARDLCKELAHGLMEADKSQDLQLAHWRPCRACGFAPSKPESLRPRAAGGVIPESMGRQAQTQEAWCSRWRQKGKTELKGRKRSLSLRGSLTFCSFQVFCSTSTDWMRPTRFPEGNPLYSDHIPESPSPDTPQKC